MAQPAQPTRGSAGVYSVSKHRLTRQNDKNNAPDIEEDWTRRLRAGMQPIASKGVML
jgi:hypothetical protein